MSLLLPEYKFPQQEPVDSGGSPEQNTEEIISNVLRNKSLQLYKNQEIKEYYKRWEYTTIVNNDKVIARIIYDRFPKAKIHLLFLPLISKINEEPFPKQYSQINKRNIEYIMVYHDIIRDICKILGEMYDTTFICGYHKNPSMSEDLHMHILSEDVKKYHKDSFRNKNKFISIDDVEREFSNYGK